jgi:hypothetical protein
MATPPPLPISPTESTNDLREAIEFMPWLEAALDT